LTPPKQANRNSQIETLVPRGTIKNEKEKIGGGKTKINGMRLKTKIWHCALLKKSERKLKGKRTKIDFSWKCTKQYVASLHNVNFATYLAVLHLYCYLFHLMWHKSL
jgi:hypothetical protein